MADVFVSYSRRDQEFVSRLVQALEARGRDVWVDWDDIPPTADWLAQIRAGIEEANDLIFVISPDSIASEVCASELAVADELNKRIVPLLVRDVESKDAPEAVGRHNWIFFDDPEKFDESVETLVGALDTDLDHVNAHTRLLVAAQRWEREDRNRSLLIRGTELNAAEAWLDAASAEKKQPAPLPLQAEFVRASRQATERRQRITVAAVSVALVVAIALAIVALVQRSNAIDQRNAATAGELDAQAQNQYDTDPELSVLLATEAAETDPGDATEEALRQAMGRSHLVATYHSPSGSPANALFSPRGDALLIADGDDTARIRTPGKPGTIELEAPGMNGQIAWSADGSAVATGGSGPAAWDARTGERLVSLPFRSGYDIAINRDASRFVGLEVSGDAHVFGVPDGRVLATFHAPNDAHGLIAGLDASTDASVIAEWAAGKNTEVWIWDGRTGRLLQTIPIPAEEAVIGLDVSDDGKRVALATSGEHLQEGAIEILRTNDARPVYRQAQPSYAAAFSPVSDNHFAFSSSSQAGFVSSASGNEVPLVGHTDTINGMAFGIGDTRLVTGSADHTARIWETIPGEQAELLAGHRDGITTVTYNSDGTLVATTSPDGDTRVWATDKPIPERSVESSGHAPDAVAVDPAGSGRVLLAGPPRTATLIDPETLEPQENVPVPQDDTVGGARWAPDGSLFAVATQQGDTLTSILAVDPDQSGSPVAIQPAGGLAAGVPAAGGRVLTISTDGDLEAWDGLTGESIRSYDVDATGAAMDVSQDGDRVALLSPEGEITVLDIESGEAVERIDGPAPEPQLGGIPAVTGLRFNASGDMIATYGGDPAVRVWDLKDGELAMTLKGGESFFDSVDFSPDGRQLVGGDANGAYLWDLDSGAVLQHLQHSDPGTFGTTLIPGFGVGVAFSPGGEQVLTGGNTRVAVWSAQTGQRLFVNPFAQVGDLSTDGATVYSGNPAELARYPCDLCGDLDELLAYARDSVTRELTETERERFLHE